MHPTGFVSSEAIVPTWSSTICKRHASCPCPTKGTVGVHSLLPFLFIAFALDVFLRFTKRLCRLVQNGRQHHTKARVEKSKRGLKMTGPGLPCTLPLAC